MSRKTSDELLEDTIEETNKVNTVEEKPIVEKPVTLYRLVSKANYTISILENGQRKFIPPFGQTTVDKENLTIEYDEDAKYLTLISN